MGVFGRLGENIAPSSDRPAQRHHQILAQRVNRRVGHFSKALFEKVEERAAQGKLREHGGGRIVAHRADRLVPGEAHRLHHHRQILAGIAKGQLQRLKVER